MRIGTLVIGGLAGAAIVMMIQRNQRMSSAAANLGQNMMHRMNNMKDDAIEKAMNMKFASSFGRASDNGQKSHKSFQAHDGGLDKVEELASQDPNVSKEINSILEQNRQHRN
jgi:Tfp pilus assembly protein PilV